MGITLSQVEGHGTQKGLTQKSTDGGYKLELLPKIRVEIVIPDSQLEPIVQAISEAARLSPTFRNSTLSGA